MKNRLLFIGNIFRENTMLKSKAISPAANRWQKGLINAINNQGIDTVLLSYFPEPIWPRGKYRPGNQLDFDPLFDARLVRYWNIPFFRNKSLSRSYIKAFRKICENYGKPLAILSYNPDPHAVATGLYAQESYNVPWIDICADQYDPCGNDGPIYPVGANKAKGHIFLSYKAYQNYSSNTKLHLDGGINNLRFQTSKRSTKNSDNQKIILYTGMLSKWGGLSYLLKAFEKIKDPDIKLWICGHGHSKDLNIALKSDSRISFLGLVPESKLNGVYRDASVFVNPRPSQILGNKMNFPSKVLVYLSYGKPVISTFTDGLSPEYRDILEILEEETEACLANKIEEILNWSENEIYQNREKIRNYLLEKKTWDIQGKNLISWLNNEII